MKGRRGSASVPNRGGARRLRKVYPIGEWRKRQTRVPQEHAGEGPCGFESRRPDQKREETVPLIIIKTLICDRCGERLDLAPEATVPESFSPAFLKGTELEGWMRFGENHFLCPDCSSIYRAKRAEMESELRKFAGIGTVEVET